MTLSAHLQSALLGVACGLFLAALVSLWLKGANTLVYLTLGGVSVLLVAVVTFVGGANKAHD